MLYGCSLRYCLQTISTSISEMGPSEPGMNDTVVECFSQLSTNFSNKFNESFSIRKTGKGKMWGGNKIHSENCLACELLLTGNQVKSVANSRPFSIRGSYDCQTPWVVFSVNCVKCKKIVIGISTKAVGKQMVEVLQSWDNGRHEDHEVRLSWHSGNLSL